MTKAIAIPRNRAEGDVWNDVRIEVGVASGSVTQAYVYQCAFCLNVVYESCEYFGEPFKPHCPDSWQELTRWNGSVYFCPNHEIKQLTFVDGEEWK